MNGKKNRTPDNVRFKFLNNFLLNFSVCSPILILCKENV
jgi:hypothetical protein